MVMKTQGSDLFVLVPAEGTGDATIVRINCVTEITGVGGGAADQVETTCLSELSDRTYVRGLRSPSSVSSTTNYDPHDPDALVLKDLADSGVSTTFFVGFSDGSLPGVDPAARPAPTLVAGVPTFPNTRSFVEFSGYVSEFGMDFAANSVVKAPIQIQRSGSIEIHVATNPLVPSA
jgi:hypothetical protein